MKTFQEWILENKTRPMHGGYPGIVSQEKEVLYDKHGMPIQQSRDLVQSFTHSDRYGSGNVSTSKTTLTAPRKGIVSKALFGPQSIKSNPNPGALVGHRDSEEHILKSPEGSTMYSHPDDAPGSAYQQYMARRGQKHYPGIDNGGRVYVHREE